MSDKITRILATEIAMEMPIQSIQSEPVPAKPRSKPKRKHSHLLLGQNAPIPSNPSSSSSLETHPVAWPPELQEFLIKRTENEVVLDSGTVTHSVVALGNASPQPEICTSVPNINQFVSMLQLAATSYPPFGPISNPLLADSSQMPYIPNPQAVGAASSVPLLLFIPGVEPNGQTESGNTQLAEQTFLFNDLQRMINSTYSTPAQQESVLPTNFNLPHPIDPFTYPLILMPNANPEQNLVQSEPALPEFHATSQQNRNTHPELPILNNDDTLALFNAMMESLKKQEQEKLQLHSQMFSNPTIIHSSMGQLLTAHPNIAKSQTIVSFLHC